MEKSIFRSKTLWGFGLAGLIAVAQVLEIGYSDALVANLVQVLSLFWGGYGLRVAKD